MMGLSTVLLRRAPALSAFVVVVCAVLCVGACGGTSDQGHTTDGARFIVADTTFMADIVRNVAGDGFEVGSLVPLQADPHSYEPTPHDAESIAQCEAVVINVTGLVPQLDDLICALGGDGPQVIEAAAGLTGAADDPHLWLDPVMVISYVDNIAEGLAELDFSGADLYRANAQEYTQRLRELDEWIRGQVGAIPADQRLLVTNHKSLSYFSARYGFRVVGALFPSVSGQSAPSAQQLAALVNEIKASGAPAIFLETGSNTDLARQVGADTGAEVVTDMYTASLGDQAATYIEMMRWNVKLIVEALK